MSGPYESCPFEVTRQHELDACGKPATTIIRHNWEGEWFVDAACTYHAHVLGGSIPLTMHQVKALTWEIEQDYLGGVRQ